MSDPKPFASLSSGLLARKGQAKPAMRPQGYGLANGYEDLGWNDMGPTHPAPRPQIVEPDTHEFQAEPPAVIRQQAEIAEGLGAVREDRLVEESVAAEPVFKVKPMRAPKAAVVPAAPVDPLPAAQPASKAKSAFTLRLDSDRHLRLRLACAIRHRSAQMIVTEALDAFLSTMPELETLARQSASAGKH